MSMLLLFNTSACRSLELCMLQRSLLKTPTLVFGVAAVVTADILGDILLIAINCSSHRPECMTSLFHPFQHPC